MSIAHIASIHATYHPGENPPPVNADDAPVSVILPIALLQWRLSCSLNRKNGWEKIDKECIFISLVGDYHPSRCLISAQVTEV